MTGDCVPTDLGRQKRAKLTVWESGKRESFASPDPGVASRDHTSVNSSRSMELWSRERPVVRMIFIWFVAEPHISFELLILPGNRNHDSY